MNSVEQSFRLDGKVAIVTGGGQGLGRAAATAIAAQGGAVAIVDLDPHAGSEVVDDIGSCGGTAYAVNCDVSDIDQARRAVSQILGEFDRIDILVANAGIIDRAPAERMTLHQWERVLAVNLTGVWNFDQLVGRHLIERRSPGTIVNMASIAGLVALSSGMANYAASKGGIIALTRCLAIEWARHGIRVNAVAPTHFRTPLVDRAITDRPELEEYFLRNIPLGRLGEVDDIMGTIVFLASAASAMVTGHVLAVDGGHTAV